MSKTAHLQLAKLDECPFVLLSNVKLTFESNGMPYIDPHIINEARSAMATKEYLQKFAEVPMFCISIRDNYGHHYFHFMETLLTLYAVHRELFPNSLLSKIYVDNFSWDNPSQNYVQHKIFSFLYPEVDILTSLTKETITVDHLLYIDRDLAHTSINKMIEPLQSIILKWATDLRQMVHKAIGAVDLSDFLSLEPLKRSPKILYVPRRPPRTLTEAVETSLLNMLSEIGTVNTVDFAQLSCEDQIRTAANHDIMIGVHGNGLTNLLWMPKHAMIIEIFPENWHHYDYQVMSEVMRLDYFGIEGFNIFRPFSRHGECYGTLIAPISRLGIDAIVLAINTFILQRISV